MRATLFLRVHSFWSTSGEFWCCAFCRFVLSYYDRHRKILHDPELYLDPMTFNPGRFVASLEKEAERDPRDFAFGFGRRFDFPLRRIPLRSLTTLALGNVPASSLLKLLFS